MQISRFVVCFLFIAMAPRARAQDGVRPEWVSARAVEVSPTLDAAAARIRAANARVAQIGSLDDPMVMARVWNVPLDVVSGPPGQIMLMAQQTIPLGGERGDRRQLERTRILDARTERELAHHAVVQEAELAFVAWWEATRRRQAVASLAQLAERTRDVVVARVGAGTASPADVAAAEIRVARAAADLEAESLRIEAARDRLAVLLALDSPDRLGTPAEVAIAAELAPLAQWLEEAQRSRPERAYARAARARSAALSDVASSAAGPMLVLGAGVMVMPGAQHTESTEVEWMIEAGISLPIWRAARGGLASEASALAGEARAADEAWQRAIAAQVVQAYQEARIARARIASLEGRVAPAARAAFDASLAQYGSGGNLALVSDNLGALAEIEIERVSTHASALRAEVMLSHAAGRTPHRFAGAGRER